LLAYQRGVVLRPSPLVWIDRQGKFLGPIEGLAGAVQFSVSPDGRRVAASRLGDIWIVELDRGVVSRFTFDPAQDTFPVWSPDGSRIVFASNRAGRKGLYQKATNSSTGEELLLAVPQLASIDSWSADGRFILYTSVDEKSKSVVWMLPTEGDRKPSMLAAAFSRSEPRISPDTRWLAYVSDESGNDEVYIEAFPPGGAKWQVSLNGGARPVWRSDGRELFYFSKDRRLTSVAIGAVAASLQISSPRPLFGIQQGRYEVSRDLFLMSSPVEDEPPVPIHVVVNWPNEIRRQ
jgi:serine/threonine-protein kinase